MIPEQTGFVRGAGTHLNVQDLISKFKNNTLKKKDTPPFSSIFPALTTPY